MGKALVAISSVDSFFFCRVVGRSLIAVKVVLALFRGTVDHCWNFLGRCLGYGAVCGCWILDRYGRGSKTLLRSSILLLLLLGWSCSSPGGSGWVALETMLATVAVRRGVTW